MAVERRGNVMTVLAVDIGGTHVKTLAAGQAEHRRFVSGSTLTPDTIVSGVKELAEGWKYDVISIGYPGQVLHGRPVAEPQNLAHGWVGFDFRGAFGCPV
jgi:polyphosphate glucokinase